IVLQSNAYSSKSSANNGVKSAKTAGIDAANYDVLEAQNGQFYFRLMNAAGKVAARGETYTSKWGAEHGADTVRKIIGELTGAGPVSDADVQKALEGAAEGILFPSESDYPYTYVQASLAANEEITETTIRAKLASFVNGDPDTDKPLASLYAMSSTWD